MKNTLLTATIAAFIESFNAVELDAFASGGTWSI